MTIWVDAQLSPAISAWLHKQFGIQSFPIRDLGLRDATDREIFIAARDQSAAVMTKDADFLRLLDEMGSPPQVILITCGNTSNAKLKQILREALPEALDYLGSGESLVEISEKT